MIDRIFNSVRGHSHILGTCLIGLIALNFVGQLYTHKTTALSSWKGGGFGMYTDPHVLNRSVWLAMGGSDDTRHVLLFPATDAATNFVKPDSVRAFNALRSQAWELRIFPTQKATQEFLTGFDDIAWLPAYDPALNGANPTDLRVVVFENQSDLQAQKLTRVPVFSSDSAGE